MPIIERDHFRQEVVSSHLEKEQLEKPKQKSKHGYSSLSLLAMLLKKPRQSARAIKKHYLAGNIFITFIVVQSLLILHVEIKVLVHLIWVGGSPERLKWTDEIYYSHFANSSTHPSLYNKMLVSVGTINLIIWFRNLRMLLFRSFENQSRYKGLSTSQLNLAHLASFRGQPIDNSWVLVNCIYDYIKFERQRKEPIDLDADDNMLMQNILIRDDFSTSLNRLVFTHNMIDFTEHHRRLESRWLTDRRLARRSVFYLTNELKEPSSRGPNGVRYRWHVCQPIHRIDPKYFMIAMFCISIASWSSWIFMIFGQIAFFMIEIWFGQLKDSSPIGSALGRCLELNRYIRFVEATSIWAMVWLMFTSVMNFVIDAIYLCCRVNRTTYLVEVELNSLRSRKFRLLRLGLLDTSGSYLMNEPAERSVMRLILLVRTVLFEMDDLKERYTGLVNLLLVGYSVQTSVCLSLLSQKTANLEKVALVVYIARISSQIIFILIAASVIERSVSIRVVSKYSFMKLFPVH